LHLLVRFSSVYDRELQIYLPCASDASQRRSVRACIRRHAHARPSTVVGGARGGTRHRRLHGRPAPSRFAPVRQGTVPAASSCGTTRPPARRDTACSSTRGHARQSAAGLAAAGARMAPRATHGLQTPRRLVPFAATRTAFGRRCYATRARSGTSHPSGLVPSSTLGLYGTQHQRAEATGACSHRRGLIARLDGICGHAAHPRRDSRATARRHRRQWAQLAIVGHESPLDQLVPSRLAELRYAWSDGRAP
jgi:hypothetical protein